MTRKNLNLIDEFKDTLYRGFNYSTPKTNKINKNSDIPEHIKPICNCKIEVELIDTVSCLEKYYTFFDNIAVLNFANPNNPGGGVGHGSKAQEEHLFRCSNLAYGLPSYHYPLNESILYTYDVAFFKNSEYKPLIDSETFECDVITAAAPIIIDKSKPLSEDYYKEILNKMSLIFNSAINNQIDLLILGAWGCGVFNNDPKVIASSFKLVCDQYKNYFKKIVFAIKPDQNNTSENFDVFKLILKEFL